MSERKPLKQIITEAVLAELPNNHSVDSSADSLMMRIWVSGRQDGLRLTEYGDFLFRMAEIEYYQCDFIKYLYKQHKTNTLNIVSYNE